MPKGLDKILKFGHFIHLISFLASAIFVISFLFGAEIENILNEFNKGMITGVIILYLVLIIFKALDDKFGWFSNGSENGFNGGDKK